ncbi:MAG: LPS-assembly protein LptD [Chlorobi bacterium]|nr:LPS-assembly protein LptD [Chlorobiota bacterium]
MNFQGIAQEKDSTNISLLQANDSIAKDTSVQITKKRKSVINAPIEYNAQDSMIFSMIGHKVYLYGSGEVHFQEITLKADYIEINLDSNTVYAYGIADSIGKVRGKPFFKQGKEEFTSDTLTFNYKSHKGLIKGVITEEGEGFLHGKITKQQANGEIHLKGGKYTTCNLEHPHFYIALSKAIVIPDDKIVTGPAYLVVAGVPIPFFLPFGFFPNTTSRASGVIIPDYGEEKNRGFYLRRGGYYFAIGEHLDFKVLGEYYTKGSWGLQFNSKYKKRYKFNGNLSANYKYTIVNDVTPPKKLFNFKWTHQQDPKAKPNSNFSANVNFGSTQYHRYDNISTQNYLSNTKQSSISYRKNWPNSPFNMSANFRHSQNSIDSTINLTLPEMTFTMNRIFPFKRKEAIGKQKWYEKIGISYSSNMRNSLKNIKDTALFDPATWKKFENGIQNSVPISTSINLKYFTLSPSVNYKERWYFHSIQKYYDRDVYINGNDTLQGRIVIDTIPGFNRVYDYSTSASLTTKLYGFYQFLGKNKTAVRHVVTPSVSISYRPDFGEPKWGYYKDYIDEKDDTIRYSIYEKAIFGTPGSGRSGSLNFRIGNNLEMKVKNKRDTTNTFKKIKLIEGFTISSSYNMLADSLNWSAISFNGRTKLFNLINITTNGRMDPYAYDSLNSTVINKFEYTTSGKLARLTSASLSAGFSINSKKLKKLFSPEEEDQDNKSEDIDPFSDFSLPWNFRIDYSLRYTKPRLEAKITQALRFSGDVSLTNKWKIGVSSGYDFIVREFTYTSINIARDLHCWQARFTWIPFGFRQQYTFTINAKASLLQDLKYNKKKSWYDNFLN